MKQLSFLAGAGLTAGILFLTSCNSSGNKTDEATTSSTDTATAKTVTPPSSTSNSSSGTMVIKHKVVNFTKWKAAYDAHDSSREANGLHNYVVARGTEDSNMVLVALKMDDTTKAKQWAASPDLKSRMKQAGVTGPVDIDYRTIVFNDTTAIQQTVRLMVKQKVKDWDAWKKAFDSHKQARIDAGLTDRVVGYSTGDNHNVAVVLAVSDIAKAKAFINSKDLKDKMKEGGVEGTPAFFFYRIVQKY